jgi:hypothetical protein
MGSRKHLLIRDSTYVLDMAFSLSYKGDIMYSAEYQQDSLGFTKVKSVARLFPLLFFSL